MFASLTRLVSAVLVIGLAMTLVHAQSSAPDAWQALEQKDAARAASLFRQALERTPSDPTLHFGAGVAAMMLGRDNDAVVSLTRALQLNPRLTEASKILARVQYARGDVDGAVTTYERALAFARNDPELKAGLETARKEKALHSTLVQRSSGRFSIVFEGRTERPTAERALATLEAAYWRIGQALGAYSSSSVTVTLYTERQFRDITGAPEWVGATFDGRIRIPANGALRDPDLFDRVLTHELTHALIFGLAPRHVPAWLHEGLASYFEPEDATVAAAVLKRARIPVIPFEALDGGFGRFSGAQAALAYTQSLVMADVLMRRIGPRMGIFLQSLDRGQSLDQSLRTFDLSGAQFTSEVAARFK